MFASIAASPQGDCEPSRVAEQGLLAAKTGCRLRASAKLDRVVTA
jgi:hypothetical protein